MVLGTTMLHVALHDLTVDLGVGIDAVQWVTTGYLLALCAVIPATAWLGSLLGARGLWLAGLAVYGLGSVLGAVAWDAGSLVAARVVQGLGGGATMPLLTTILVRVTPVPDRVRVASLVGLVTAVGPVLGPAVGGAVLEVGGWRWLLWLNVPGVVLGLVLGHRMVEREPPQPRARLDVVGLVLLPPGLAGLLVGLSQVSSGGGAAAPGVLVPGVAGLLLLVGFTWWAARRQGAALVDVRVLREPATRGSALVLLVSGAVVQAVMVLLPLTLQRGGRAGALDAGLLLVVQGLGALASRTPALWLVESRGPRTVGVLGFGLVALATAPLAVVPDLESLPVVLTLLVRGLGLGMVVVPFLATAFDDLAPDRVPHASVVVRVAQQLGGALGVAGVAVVLTLAPTGDAGAVTAFWCATGAALLGLAASLLLPGPSVPGTRGSTGR